MDKIMIIEHEEPLDELIQLSESEEETLQEAIRLRIKELLADENIDEDDVKDIYSGITVSITIHYKKKEDENEGN